MTSDAVKRSIRTFIITFFGLMIPGFLGWLNEVTKWANDNGQAPFPDGKNLSYLAVSALAAAVIGAVNLLWTWVEDKIGKGLLREVPPK